MIFTKKFNLIQLFLKPKRVQKRKSEQNVRLRKVRARKEKVILKSRAPSLRTLIKNQVINKSMRAKRRSEAMIQEIYRLTRNLRTHIKADRLLVAIK